MKRRILVLIAVLLSSAPAMAVLDEANMDVTLSELRFELASDYGKLVDKSSAVYLRKENQHAAMVEIMRKCNELSLILYSQSPECTFDMTYAFKEVTKQYREFTDHKTPYEVIVAYLDSELERYARLAESLRRLPPQIRVLDEIPDSLRYRNDSLVTDRFIRKNRSTFMLEGQALADRDTCLYYATQILNLLAESKEEVLQDHGNYEEADARLRESYDYANGRFLAMQTELFTKPSDSYPVLLSNLSQHLNAARSAREVASTVSRSEWHGAIAHRFIFGCLVLFVLSVFLGFVVIRIASKRFSSPEFLANRPYLSIAAGFLIFFLFSLYPKIITVNSFVALSCRMITLYSWLSIATLLSTVVIRWKKGPALLLRFYAPLLLLSFMVLLFRVSFVSNTMLQLIFTPLLLITLVWMSVVYMKIRKSIRGLQFYLCLAIVSVIAVASVLAVIGYNFLSLIIVVWISLQIAILQTLYIFKAIVVYYGDRCRSRLEHDTSSDADALKETRGDFIAATWPYDLLEMMVIPVLNVLLFIQCAWYSLYVFDMTDIFESLVNKDLSFASAVDGTSTVHLNIRMFFMAISLYFAFRFLAYAVRSLVRLWKVEKFKRTSGKTAVQTTDVNLTLGNNIIGILVWGLYVIVIFIIFHLPTSAITMISAGLAAGLGMAMKDIVNNFIYGIQLMSGSLRPGDWIECDGIRGRVTEIKYQCTQIETIDGAMMSFLNAELLSKNFKNLTRNDRYEYYVIKVEIAYDSDLDMVRRVLTEGLAKIDAKDRFGQDYVDRTRGTVISFNDFGVSGVVIQIEQYILVSMYLVCVPMLKEAVYHILNENGIELPNQPLDIFIKK